MQLVHLPVVRKRSVETLFHTALSVVHPSLGVADAAIVFNAANSPLLPAIRVRRDDWRGTTRGTKRRAAVGACKIHHGFHSG